MGLEIEVTINNIPDAELAQATQIEIHERMGYPTTYRVEYEIDIQEQDLPMLVDGRLQPGVQMAFLASTAYDKHCLVKGPVHGQQIHLEDGGAGSRCTVIGSDTSLAMDRETHLVQWTDVTDSDAVHKILLKYGYRPDVERTQAGHFEAKHTLIQRDSDLRFIRRLARRNGYLFWVRCDALGLETAHFKRPPLSREAIAELTINRDEATISSLDLVWDVERPTQVQGQQLDLNTLKAMDGQVQGSSLSLLGEKGLAQIADATRSIHLLAPADDTGDLQARGQGLLAEAGWFLRATCHTSLHKLGRILRTHSIVNVSGAGSRYSGRYWVAGVRHTIDATAHHMELTLLRNGWLT